MRYFHLLGLKHMARLITSFCQTYIWLQPPIACNFQYLRNILCLHSSVLFSSVTGKISQPVHLGQPMTLSCNSNQVKKLLKVSLKFCCSLLISALSNHRATKNPRCSILTLSLTAAGLSIFCVTRQNASKNRFHYIFINFNNKLLRMSGNFPETFQTFPENLCLVWIWFSFKLCWYPQNLYGQKNFTLAMSTSFFYLWCYTGTVTVVRDKINSRKKQKLISSQRQKKPSDQIE